MDLEKLRCCVSLSRHLNFTRAAEENFISQPSMTQKINSLEQELGVQLFRRSNREVSLTEAGRSFVQDAQAILLAYQDAVLRAQSIQAREPASLTLGYAGLNAGEFLPALLERFHAVHPGVGLRMRKDTLNGLNRRLLAGEADMIFSNQFEMARTRSSGASYSLRPPPASSSPAAPTGQKGEAHPGGPEGGASSRLQLCRGARTNSTAPRTPCTRRACPTNPAAWSTTRMSSSPWWRRAWASTPPPSGITAHAGKRWPAWIWNWTWTTCRSSSPGAKSDHRPVLQDFVDIAQRYFAGEEFQLSPPCQPWKRGAAAWFCSRPSFLRGLKLLAQIGHRAPCGKPA